MLCVVSSDHLLLVCRNIAVVTKSFSLKISKYVRRVAPSLQLLSLGCTTGTVPSVPPCTLAPIFL